MVASRPVGDRCLAPRHDDVDKACKPVLPVVFLFPCVTGSLPFVYQLLSLKQFSGTAELTCSTSMFSPIVPTNHLGTPGSSGTVWEVVESEFLDQLLLQTEVRVKPSVPEKSRCLVLEELLFPQQLPPVKDQC